MTSDCVEHLLTAIHDSPAQACLVLTGAGSSAISTLFSIGGASRTVLDVQVPYSTGALEEYLGDSTKQHVSAETAKIMAIAAQRRAKKLARDADHCLVGISCTAAIATDRERRGENRAHVAWHEGANGATYSIVMDKGKRDRAGEEEICRILILNALAEAAELDITLPLPLRENENVHRTQH